MPSFAGSDIFGVDVSMSTADQPLARQQNAYPGVNGVESLTMGSRGRVTAARGRLRADSLGGLAALMNGFRSLRDGNAYPLVDTMGVTWPFVVLERFAPDANTPIYIDQYGFYTKPYMAEFVHLI